MYLGPCDAQVAVSNSTVLACSAADSPTFFRALSSYSCGVIVPNIITEKACPDIYLKSQPANMYCFIL